MDKASLIGLDDDGTSLVLSGPGGQRLVLPIDEALRAALRADRSGLERAKVEAGGELRPREIQARVRAGESPEDLADGSGMDLGQIMKFAAPVLDERAYVASRAVDLPVAHDLDSPTIGSLVRRRLLEAGVAPEDIQFDSVRLGKEWQLVAHYGERAAVWRIDLADRICEPRDEAARRLISGEDLGPVPTRHLAAVQDGPAPVSRVLPPSAAFHPSAATPPTSDPNSLLDDLDDARGRRTEIHLTEEFDIVSEPQENAQIVPLGEQLDLPTLELPGERSEDRPEAEHDADGAEQREGQGDPEDDPVPPPPVRPTSRPKRASVPSWDEIVFGAKPE